MVSIRHYIDLIEASWWPQKRPVQSASHPGPTGWTTKPSKPREPNNFSGAIGDLQKIMYQIQMGRDDYDHADHLAGQLLKQAQSSGFSEYVPILSQIVNYLNRGQGKQAVPLVDKLMNQFKNQMATDKNQY